MPGTGYRATHRASQHAGRLAPTGFYPFRFAVPAMVTPCSWPPARFVANDR